MRAGAELIGELERSGVGRPLEVDSVKSVAELRRSCLESNQVLLREPREDNNAEELLRRTQADVLLGRMREIVSVQELDLAQVLLNPRFGVEQEKDDGRIKVRAVDHLSWSPSTREAGGWAHKCTKKDRKAKGDGAMQVDNR